MQLKHKRDGGAEDYPCRLGKGVSRGAAENAEKSSTLLSAFSAAPRATAPSGQSRANAASKATFDGEKSTALIFAHASRAPNSRSMPMSSHSMDSGPW